MPKPIALPQGLRTIIEKELASMREAEPLLQVIDDLFPERGQVFAVCCSNDADDLENGLDRMDRNEKRRESNQTAWWNGARVLLGDVLVLVMVSGLTNTPPRRLYAGRVVHIEAEKGNIQHCIFSVNEWRPIGSLKSGIRSYQGKQTAPKGLTLLSDFGAGNTPALSFPPSLPGTDVEATIKARRGQDRFRRDVKSLWEDRCSILNIDVPGLLIASHIHSWSDAKEDAKSRTDPHNGLLLTAHLDRLFDGGRISFADDGELLWFAKNPLKLSDKASLGLVGAIRLRKSPSAAMQKYLLLHRKKHGF
jgi:hypothetical protein